MFTKNFIQQCQFSFGKLIVIRFGFEGDFVVGGFADVLGPDAGISGATLIGCQIENLAQNRTCVHGDVAICGDGATPAQEGLTISQVKKLDEFHVTHGSSAQLEQATCGLGGLTFIEFQSSTHRFKLPENGG